MNFVLNLATVTSMSIVPLSDACCIASASVIKKSLAASERRRLDIAQARNLWIHRRTPFFLQVRQPAGVH
jgi:hypothetical protein